MPAVFEGGSGTLWLARDSGRFNEMSMLIREDAAVRGGREDAGRPPFKVLNMLKATLRSKTETKSFL